MINKPEGAASPVTLWSRKNEKGSFEFNHLEDGHCSLDAQRPTPKTDVHKSAWGKGEWAFEHAWLDGNIPPKVLHDPQEQTVAALRRTPKHLPVGEKRAN